MTDENKYDTGTFRFITIGSHYDFINYKTLRANNMNILEKLYSSIVTDFVNHMYIRNGVKKLFEN